MAEFADLLGACRLFGSLLAFALLNTLARYIPWCRVRCCPSLRAMGDMLPWFLVLFAQVVVENWQRGSYCFLYSRGQRE